MESFKIIIGGIVGFFLTVIFLIYLPRILMWLFTIEMVLVAISLLGGILITIFTILKAKK